MMCPSEHPRRSVVILADDVSPEETNAAMKRFADILTERGFMPRDEFLRRSRAYALLRAVIVPVPLEVFRDAVPVGTERVIAVDEERISIPLPPIEIEMEDLTGVADPLDATGVLGTKCSGTGQLIVVLDSGFDPSHPDFKRRYPLPTVETFTTVDPTDNPAHGTRSMGLAGGPLNPSDGKVRYGVAHEASLFFGCVLGPDSIPDEAIFDGLTRAIREGATVVNMSLGTTVMPRQEYNIAFELIAQRTLAAGVLPIASAGNDPSGAGVPVYHPANCPSVLSVGAVDGRLEPLLSSAVRINCDGEIDIVAPGYAIRASTAGAKYYNEKTGTSSAAPLVSGIAALWAQKTGFRGCDLWNVLIDNAHAVKNGSRRTTGAGLVQAPSSCRL